MELSHNFTIEQLLVALQIGDSNAFNEIYCRYRKKVHGYAYHFVRCPEEAEELTQDVFVRLWESRTKIDPAKNFDAYLFTIIRNNFLGALRKKAKMTAFKNETLEDDPSLNSIEHYMDFKESRQLANQAISTLPPQAKMAYLLSRDMGYSHENISVEMGITKNTVNNHIKKSLGHIKKHFSNYSPETIISLIGLIQLYLIG